MNILGQVCHRRLRFTAIPPAAATAESAKQTRPSKAPIKASAMNSRTTRTRRPLCRAVLCCDDCASESVCRPVRLG